MPVHQWAFCALKGSPGARAYYIALRARGIGHQAALRQLGNRLVGILHGCLKTRSLYDEHTAWEHHQQSAATSGGYSIDNPDYWHDVVRPRVLRAIGIHSLGAEARKRMQPDSPDLAADQLHPWVWEAAAPLWNAGSRPDAIYAAARSVNAHPQQMRGHHDKSEAALCREFFSPDPPAPGRPHLRFPGTTTSATWRSRQQGAMEFGAGCFTGIRNPVAHEYGLKLTEQVALEYLAAFSVLARSIDECTVEAVS